MIDPVKLKREIRKLAANAAVGQAIQNKQPSPTVSIKKPSMSSLKPRMEAQPAAKPGMPSIGTTPGNLTMTQGPPPATGPSMPPSMPTTPRSDVGMRAGTGISTSGPAPKTAEAASNYLKKRLSEAQPPKLELPKPPSLKQPKPPTQPTAFRAKTPNLLGDARSGATKGTT